MAYEYIVKIEENADDSLKNQIISMLKKNPKLKSSKEERGIFSCYSDTIDDITPGWWDLKIKVSDDGMYVNRTDSSYIWKDIEDIKEILDNKCKYDVVEP